MRLILPIFATIAVVAGTTHTETTQPAAASRPEAAAPGILLADDRVTPVTAWWTVDGGTVDALPAEGSATLSPLKIALWERDHRPEPYPRVPTAPTATALIVWRSGEVIAGSLEASGDKLLLVSPAWGGIELRLEEIDTVRLARRSGQPAWLPAGAGRPGLILANGDALGGPISALDAGSVSIDSDFGATPVELSRVAWILPAPPPGTAPRQRPSAQYACALGSGEVWHVDRLELRRGGDTVELERAGKRATVPLAALWKVVFPGWREEPLLEPTRISPATTIDGAGGAITDTPGKPRPLAIAGRGFAGGITLVPPVEAVYDTAPQAGYLVGWTGLDAGSAPRARAVLRFHLDPGGHGDAAALAPGDPPRRIAMPVKTAATLTLQAIPEPSSPGAARINCCDLRLLVPATGSSRAGP